MNDSSIVPSGNGNQEKRQSTEERFVDVLQIRAETERRQVENEVELARIQAETERLAISSFERDRDGIRTHESKNVKRYMIFGASILASVFIVVIILYAMGKDAGATELLKIMVYTSLGGTGGYFMGKGRGQAQPTSPNNSPSD